MKRKVEWLVYDFALCADVEELKQTLDKINHSPYCLISVTQDGSGVYTVFFQRPVDGSGVGM